MQGPPMDLRMPKTESRDSVRGVPAAAVLFAATLTVFLAVWIFLMVAHEEHAYHGDRAMTPEFEQCLNDQMDEFVRTGVPQDSDDCKPVMPTYAAHPFWYALIAGVAVLVIGRIGMFMYRMERSRGY